MADHYLQFSTVLHVGSVANARVALAWLDDPSNPLDLERPDHPGFTVTEEGCEDGELHLYAEEAGDPDAVLAFARKCGSTFKLAGRWGFAWAETCSKPRPDEFGGGAVVLDLSTGDSDYITLAGWLASARPLPVSG